MIFTVEFCGPRQVSPFDWDFEFDPQLLYMNKLHVHSYILGKLDKIRIVDYTLIVLLNEQFMESSVWDWIIVFEPAPEWKISRVQSCPAADHGRNH